MSEFTCKECGTGFEPRFQKGENIKKFCSKNCKDKSKDRERHKRNYVPREKVVRLCDVEGCNKKHVAQGCCAVHYKRWQIQQGNLHYGIGAGIRYEKERAERFGVEYEPINRTGLYVRDDFTCQICLEPLDMDAVFPDPLSPSLDHIIPISKGGPHIWSNVQSAHLSCNCRKKDGVKEAILWTSN